MGKEVTNPVTGSTWPIKGRGGKNQPTVITMCGSSRFCDIMAVCAWLLEKEEGVVTMGLHLLPDWYKPTTLTVEEVAILAGQEGNILLPEGHLAELEGVAEHFDNLHLKKIDISDGIFVVDWNKYIGESTQREIHYASLNRKGVRYLSQEPYYLSEVARQICRYVRESKKNV